VTRPSITSSSNHRLKAVRRLRRRPDARLFLVEGHRSLRHALETGMRVEQLYAARELFIGPEHAGLVALAERRGAAVLEVSGTAFLSISLGVRPDGLAALVERWPTELGALSLPAEPLVVVAEGIERPGNLGALMRTAHAAGADAFLVCNSPTDVFHPETVRASVPMAGGADSVNVAVAAGVVLFEAARQRGVYEATSAVETTAPLERTTPSSQRASTRPPPNCWR
jgi:TrmH family RNA methyltransferase